VAVVNLVVPIAAHELDYRYALSAVPFACLAFGLTFGRRQVAATAAAGSVLEGAPAASTEDEPAGPVEVADGAPAGADGQRATADGARASGGEAPAGAEGSRAA